MEIFEESAWAMTLGERAALEGVLAQLKPKLALEIGTSDGASLRRIAGYAEEVHCFAPATPQAPVGELPNVTLQTGDRRQLLPAQLERFAEQARNVDFVLVDGGDAAEGVRGDLEDLLSSAALADALILVHGLIDERVRAAVDAVPFGAFPKVAHVNLDFVPGQMLRSPARHELRGGLGLVIVDAKRTAYFPAVPVVEDRYYEAGSLYQLARDLVVARERGEPDTAAEAREQRTLAEELEAVREEREQLRQLTETVTGSVSWKITAPLRAGMHRVRRRGAKATGSGT